MAAHAYETVPHYREIMDGLGLTPADFRTVDDLAKLPITSGRNLAKHPARFRSSAIPERATLKLVTTGTSGAFRQVHYDRRALFNARAVGLRERDVLRRFLGHGVGYREIGVARDGGTRPVIQDYYREHAWIPRAADVRRTLVSPADSFEENLEVINTFQPDLMVGFGAYIGAIFRSAWLNDREIYRPEVISYGGDTLRPPDRQLIERHYQIPVFSTYQACEALHIAFQCERRQGFHIHEDQVNVRVVDQDGRDVEPGESGSVVISNLVNRATVLLNYELGDLVTLSPVACPCGRTLQLLESFVGRTEDLVVRPDGQVAHETVILPRLYDVPGVLQVQLEQMSMQQFIVRVVAANREDWSRIRQRLDTELRSVLGGGNRLSLEIESVSDIPCEPGGKYSAIRSRCRPDAYRRTDLFDGR
jgi:phenylacetate-CoA ligase